MINRSHWNMECHVCAKAQAVMYYTETGLMHRCNKMIHAKIDRGVNWQDMELQCVGFPNAEKGSERLIFRGCYAAVGVEIANGWNYGVNRIFPRGMCTGFSGRVGVFKGLINNI